MAPPIAMDGRLASMPPDDAELDCRACGACCRGRAGTVLIAAGDLDRWRRAGRMDLTRALVPGHFGLEALEVQPDGRCIHLGAEAGALDCAIYALRPRACRDLVVGGPECLAARRRGSRDLDGARSSSGADGGLPPRGGDG